MRQFAPRPSSAARASHGRVRNGWFAMTAGLLAWAAGEGRSMHDVDLDVERPTGFIRRIVNFLKERV